MESHQFKFYNNSVQLLVVKENRGFIGNRVIIGKFDSAVLTET